MKLCVKKAWEKSAAGSPAALGKSTPKLAPQIPKYRQFPPALLGALLGIVCCVATASRASAYDRQLSLGFAANYGVAVAAERWSNHGVGGALQAGYGFDDTWTVRALGAYQYHPATSNKSAFHLMQAGSELLYVLDVLQLVPFFGAGVDGFFALSSDGRSADLAVHAVGGLDWFFSRQWLIGIDARVFLLPTAFGTDPVYLMLGLRIDYLFDLS